MVSAVSPVGVTNDNYGTKAVKYGTVSGVTGALLSGAVGALSAPHMDLETKGLTDKFVSQAVLNLDDKYFTNDEKLVRNFLKLNPKKATVESFAELFAANRDLVVEYRGKSYDEVKQLVLNEYKNNAELFKKDVIKPQKGAIRFFRDKLEPFFDEEGFLKKIPEGASEETVGMNKSLRKTLRQNCLKTAGKWALIGGGILAGIGLAIGACNKKEAPKNVQAGLNVVA